VAPALAALAAAAVGVVATLLLTRAPEPGPPESRATVSAPSDPGVRGEALLYAPDSAAGQLVLELTGLAEAPSGHHYEVWVLRSAGGGEMEAVGSFSAPESGSVRLELPLPGPGAYRAVDISLEDDGGSPEHSGTSVAGGSFDPA
jgi:anti-sigma-K factor RskA